MNPVKIAILILFILSEAFNSFLDYLDYSYSKRELPDNVKDVYDEEKYKTWRSYNSDNTKLSIVSSIVSNVLMLAFLLFNLYAKVFKLFDGINMYLQYFFAIAFLTIVILPGSIPFEYYDTFVIEEKYGMNKSTKKTFVLDQIKSFVIDLITSFALMALIMFFFEKFGNKAVIFTVIAMVVISLLLNLIIMPILRIFNKFEPLEEGELKDELLKLCEKYGVTVKKICVKDASRRTTKANAFCTGIGKKKVISLDDNLVNDYSTDQIVAVFAHEFAHAKYKHGPKSLPFGILRMAIALSVFGVVLNIPSMFTAFGFDGVNYFWASAVLSMLLWPLERVLDIISNYLSRKHEYQADEFAAKEGYGDALISSLKKLSRDALVDLNPHPWIVKLNYSHPTLSQRIDAIKEKSKMIQ